MNKLRQIIREELLKEASVDRGFMNGFAEALEDLTGRDAHVKSNEEHAVRYDGKSNRLDIYLRGGGAQGGRLGGELEIQVIDARGRVRTGIDVPADPDVAAEELARELDKINEMKLTERKLRSIIREELLTEMSHETLHGGVSDPAGLLADVAQMLQRQTGRDATEVPAGRNAGMGDIDRTGDSLIIFEGRNQNLYISLEATRGGVSGHIRTVEGRMLRSFDTGRADAQSIASRAASALREVGAI
mgnify:CR=1 FL=1